MNPELADKYARLLDELAGAPLLVAFSGGVDSSLLLAAAREAAPERLLAVTGVSPSLAQVQLDQARRVARDLGVEHLELGTTELEDARYTANPANRCYFCKHELYGRLRADFGAAWRIVDGTNADDLGGHRPGRQAAREEDVSSPLAELGLRKEEIRSLSHHHGLETADAPASPCLASRIMTGVAVDGLRLARVERAEAAVRALGFSEFRVRDLGDRARFELAEAEHGALVGREEVVRNLLLASGFEAAAIDPRPLRSGRLSAESGA